MANFANECFRGGGGGEKKILKPNCKSAAPYTYKNDTSFTSFDKRGRVGKPDSDFR